MPNKFMLMIAAGIILSGCSTGVLDSDYGKAVKTNAILQTENINAPEESHPEIKMDGQKAADVIVNYRKEGPEADTSELTK